MSTRRKYDHGGRRAGAGRKPALESPKAHQFVIEGQHYLFLAEFSAQTGRSASDILREILDAAEKKWRARA